MMDAGTEDVTTGRVSMGRMGAILRLVAVGITALVTIGSSTLTYAFWSAPGSGLGFASVGTVASPTAVTISSFGPTVTVSWTGVTPPAGTLAGYTVTRYAGATPSKACGTDPATPATFIPAGTLTCSDTSVPDGTYAYTVTAVFRTWTAQSTQSNAITVVGDQTKPNQSVTVASGASNAQLVGATLYYRGTASGSFQLVDTVTGVASAPASATFPNISATGWTHSLETVTSGSGSAPSIAYSSSSISWTASPANPATYTVAGADTLGNTVNTPLSFASDTTGPTGGALTVNATSAGAGGTASYATSGFSINARTDYAADAGAGLATSVLTRESATLVANTCGTFAGSTVQTGTPAQSGLTTGCYRYTLTGNDNVGNPASISTIVKYDTGLPTQAVTLGSGVNASQTGNVIYFRNTVPGSFSLSSAVTDTETSSASVNFPLISTAGWTHPAETVTSGTGAPPTIAYSSSSYAFATNASTPGAHSVVGKDTAGNPVTTGLTFVKDVTVPVSGKLTINAVSSSAAGTTSFNKTGAPAFTLRTDFTDAASGIASSVLTVAAATLSANTCGSYGPPTTIVGSPAQSGLTTGCWKYVLTGTDKVGNVATTTTTVKVDLVPPPAGGALTVNGVAASTAGTTSGPTNAASFPIDSRTDYSIDAESGFKTSTLTRQGATLTAGVCGTFTGTITTLVGTPLQTTLATSCYKYLLTGTDNALNATAIFTIVKYDITPPTAGALTVNAVAASAAGTASTANTASFTIGTRTANADAASGLASSTLTRQLAPLTGSTCGSFGSAAVIVGNPAQSGLATGCYQYTLTGVDNAGNSIAISTTVKLGVYVTAVSLTNVTGTAGRVDQGDKIVFTFSDQLDVSTLCSTWSGNGSDQAINGDNQATVTLTNGGASFDTLTMSSSMCTLNLGTLSLGSTLYTTANVTFAGAGAAMSTIAWSVPAKQLTITLGQVSGAGPVLVASSAVTYTPSISVLNVSGVATGGTFATAAVKQF